MKADKAHKIDIVTFTWKRCNWISVSTRFINIVHLRILKLLFFWEQSQLKWQSIWSCFTPCRAAYLGENKAGFYWPIWHRNICANIIGHENVPHVAWASKTWELPWPRRWSASPYGDRVIHCQHRWCNPGDNFQTSSLGLLVPTRFRVVGGCCYSYKNGEKSPVFFSGVILQPL